MICPILTAIEIIDEAQALFDRSVSNPPVILIGGHIGEKANTHEPGTIEMVNYSISGPSTHHLCTLYDTKLIPLRERTGYSHDLVEAINNLLIEMIKHRRAIRWQRVS